MRFMLFVIALMLCTVGFRGEYFYFQWFSLLVTMGVLVGAYVWRNTNSIAGLCVGYTIFSSILVISGHRFNWLSEIEPIVQMRLMRDASYSLVCFLLMGWVLINADKKWLATLRQVVGFLCAVDIVWVIIQFFTRPNPIQWGGIALNPSMNGCFIAVSWVFLWENLKNNYQKTLLACGVLAAVGISRASNPYGVLLVTTIFFLAPKVTAAQINWKRLLGGCTVVAAVYVMAIYTGNGEGDGTNTFWSSANRFDMYKYAVQFWWDNDRVLLGFGQGTFNLIGPWIQTKHQFMVGNWFIWLHSDWLQLLIEQGIIGFGLYTALLISLVRQCYLGRDWILLAAFMGYASTGIFNYPIRYGFSSFLGMYLVIAILRTERDTTLVDYYRKFVWT